MVEGEVCMPRFTKNQFLKLQKKHKTDQAIGDLFGISRQAVHQWRDMFGIPFVKDRNKKRNDEIRAMYENGTSVVKIVKKYRLSMSQVYRLIRG